MFLRGIRLLVIGPHAEPITPCALFFGPSRLTSKVEAFLDFLGEYIGTERDPRLQHQPAGGLYRRIDTLGRSENDLRTGRDEQLTAVAGMAGIPDARGPVWISALPHGREEVRFARLRDHNKCRESVEIEAVMGIAFLSRQ